MTRQRDLLLGSRRVYTEALSSLNRRLNGGNECFTDTTIAAVMTLSIYEVRVDFTINARSGMLTPPLDARRLQRGTLNELGIARERRFCTDPTAWKGQLLHAVEQQNLPRGTDSRGNSQVSRDCRFIPDG
jgi:hypothetical protein